MSTPNRSEPHVPPPGLEDDPEGALVVSEELRLLSTVLTTLAAAEARAAEPTGGDDVRLLELREEVAVAKPEDLPSLFEQMHHIGALRAQRGRGQNAGIDRASPYFGHLRLTEGGRRRDVLVGARSYVEPGAGVRIVDWRNAPVSRIFYRYGEGDDYEEQLGGRTVEGVVTARRSVAILKGELLRVASPQGTFTRLADGTWRRMQEQAVKLMTERRYGPKGTAAAGTHASPAAFDGPKLGMGADGAPRLDKMLPAIAAMLDPAQFDLIAKPGAGLVAIQGSAGSGKTTVGLHRVAYLAFQDPQRFRPDRMLVVVPHEGLVHYVGRVLPTLGVEGVPVTTFGQWGGKVLAGLFPRLSTTLHEDTPPVVTRAKMHPAMLGGIDRLVAKVNAKLDARVQSAMERWPQGADVIAAWTQTAKLGARGIDKTMASIAPDSRVTALSQWLAGKRVLDGSSPASHLPDVTRSALEKLGQELRHESRAVQGLWDELLTDRPGLAETFAGVDGLGPGQLDQVYEWTVRQARVRGEGERDGEHATLDAEDVGLLLRAYQRLRGPLVDAESKPIRFNHLFVDEVQDASPIELRVLLDLAGAEQSITLAGDLAQRMQEDASEFDWQKLLSDLGVPHTQIEPLKVSYRSTKEITTFARGVLGPFAHEAEPIATRNGPPVELFSFASPGEAVAFLADALRQLARDEPYANVALLARFSAQADIYYEGLSRAEVPNVRRVRALDFSWEPGFDITDVRQTKGLEFDEVVLLETSQPSYPDQPAARHALYVGATRAAHQLWCVTTEAPSPLVLAGLELNTTAEA